MGIYDQYFKIYHSLYKKYGPKLVVLFEEGSFYEVYGDKSNANDRNSEKTFYEICEICNLNIQRNSHGKPDAPLKCGFQKESLPKYLESILKRDYWVALCDQKRIGTDKYGKPLYTREVTSIFNSATYLNSRRETQNILLLYHSLLSLSRVHVLGMACVNVTTGEIRLFEGHGTMQEKEKVLEDVDRWVLTFSPSQIVVVGKDSDLFRGLRGRNLLFMEEVGKLSNIAYQEQLLEHYYPSHKTDASNLIELFGLAEKEYGRVALMHLVEFLYETEKGILDCLKPPVCCESSQELILEKNAIKQLNLVDLTDRALGVIKCQTAMGRALLQERLLRPSRDVETIRSWLDFAESCDEKLTLKVPDLRLVVRTMATGRSKVSSVRALYEALLFLRDLKFTDKMRNHPDAVQWHFDELLQEMESIFDLNELKAGGLAIFRDRLQVEQGDYVRLSRAIEYFADRLGGIAGHDRVQTKETKKEGLVFYGSKSVLGQYTDRFFNEGFEIQLDDETFRWDRAHVSTRVSSGTILYMHSRIAGEYGPLREHLQGCVAYEVREAMRNLYRKYEAVLSRTIYDVGRLDLGMATIEYGRKNKYVRPELIRSESSYFYAKDLRHPIIEKVLVKHPYVPNDFELTADRPGIVLYGINSSGKSSAMRAVGTAVVMAQAGLHVPCAEFCIAPFHNLMTRIMGGDDIMRGESSYTVEIMECIPIATRASRNTLVLGDEIGHGTEVASGSALVSALIEDMARKEVKFLIATHMRALETLTASPNIVHKHIHVGKDENGKPVFDRKIRDGSGPDTYGLEIAEYLRMPLPIIHSAYRKHKQLKNHPENLVRNVSRYNSRKIHAPLCARSGCSNPAQEEDHVVPQYRSDQNGFIGNVSVHHPSNIEKLCKSCHQKKTRQDRKRKIDDFFGIES
jgi:DNA mismatch repair protein MutS